MKRFILVATVFILGVYLIGCSSTAVLNSRQGKAVNLYENKDYNVTLSYKKDWKLNTLYYDRYEGEDGFFQVSALSGGNLNIDEVAENEVNHKLKPYGSNPQISILSIQGQEARLIIPSDDQSEETKNQAEIIIKYPKELKIDGTMCYYFVLFADKNNIQDIAKTINFTY